MFMKNGAIRRLVSAIAISTFLSFAIPSVARAATFNIADGDVAGLKAAINAANATSAADVINLAPGGTYTLTTVDNNGFFGPTGLPQITSPLTIVGNGATIQRSGAAGIPAFRILFIFQSNVTLDTLTLSGGQGDNSTGGVGAGGGFAMAGGTVLLRRSTVTGNFGMDGGGIANFAGSLTIENRTISYNTASVAYGGGGILNANFYSPGPATTSISFSTIFENRAESPSFAGRGDSIADAFSPVGSIIVKNSILASPTRGLGAACAFVAPTSQGHNIVGDNSCALNGVGDLNGTDPQLGTTTNNGGPTVTSLPAIGGPAINGVPVADCTNIAGAAVPTDQRGIPRPQGPMCDIGSVEVSRTFTQPVAPPLASPAGAVTWTPPNVRLTTAYMMLGGNGNPRQHSWAAKADASGSLTVTVQAGAVNCCADGSQLPGGGTITASVFGATGLLGTFNITQPALSPPAAYESRTFAATPGELYTVTVSVPVGPAFSTYRLKFDGAEEAGFQGSPAVAAGLATLDGLAWVMNVNPGDALTFTLLPGGPANFYGFPNVIKETYVTVFDPGHTRRVPLTSIALNGSTITVPDAGNAPGAWTVVVVQPSHDFITDPSLRPPYRLVKGAFNFSTNSIVLGTAGIDPGIYTAWFTSGDGSFAARIDSPPAITSVEVALSTGMCSGVEAPNCEETLTAPTNQDIADDGAGVGQFHVTLTVPPGTVADVAQVDYPLTSDSLTTLHFRIRDVTAPVLTLPLSTTTEAAGPGGAAVTFTASASDQIDGPRPVTCDRVSGSMFPLGTTTVHCSASDLSGNTTQSTFLVTVADTTPPVISSATSNPGSLWPPNHKMVNVAISVSVADNCDAGVQGRCRITSVTSNEAIQGPGSGNTTPDYIISGDLTLQLRAERSGGKKDATDRIYTITILCTDASGNSATKTATVIVPHDQR